MKCLITGGTGFIGKSLANFISKKYNKIDSKRANPHSNTYITGTQSESVPNNVKFLPLNLHGIDWNSLEDIEVLFHQAAINDTRFDDKKQIMEANYKASKILFEKLLKKGCKQFVFASTTAIYGDAPAPYIEEQTDLNPQTFYAESKLKLEEFAIKFGKNNGVNVIGLRYCNVYGPGEEKKGKRMSMVGQILRKILKKEQPDLFTDGSQKRDWIYIKDVVSANLCAANYNGINIFNCGSGKATDFNTLVEIINKNLNFNIKPNYIKNPYKNTYQDFTLCDMKKSKKLLKFIPKYDIRKGINNYIKNIKNQLPPPQERGLAQLN